LFLACLLDLYSRKIVGWAMGESLATTNLLPQEKGQRMEAFGFSGECGANPSTGIYQNAPTVSPSPQSRGFG
jgi:hypothetical protein